MVERRAGSGRGVRSEMGWAVEGVWISAIGLSDIEKRIEHGCKGQDLPAFL